MDKFPHGFKPYSWWKFSMKQGTKNAQCWLNVVQTSQTCICCHWCTSFCVIDKISDSKRSKLSSQVSWNMKYINALCRKSSYAKYCSLFFLYFNVWISVHCLLFFIDLSLNTSSNFIEYKCYIFKWEHYYFFFILSLTKSLKRLQKCGLEHISDKQWKCVYF